VATPNGSAASGDAPINNMVSTPMRDTFPMEGSDTSASRLHRVSSRPFDQKDSEIGRSRKSEHQHYSLRAAAFGLRFGVKTPSDPKSGPGHSRRFWMSASMSGKVISEMPVSGSSAGFTRPLEQKSMLHVAIFPLPGCPQRPYQDLLRSLWVRYSRTGTRGGDRASTRPSQRLGESWRGTRLEASDDVEYCRVTRPPKKRAPSNKKEHASGRNFSPRVGR
jgi:hypothetical protein